MANLLIFHAANRRTSPATTAMPIPIGLDSNPRMSISRSSLGSSFLLSPASENLFFSVPNVVAHERRPLPLRTRYLTPSAPCA